MKTAAAILGFLLIVAIAIFLPAWLFMLAWNFALVPLFGAPVLSYWISFAIVFILQMIGGFFKNHKKD